MDLELQWLLLGLPVAFALGWLASRFDLRQLRRDHEDSPRAYFKGLNLLLNEQQDEAVDAFIEAVQSDPDTAELHFALGNLFRRRGEFERAVRVHQHLLGRGDLKAADRDRAQLALAQDFMKAGLFDRAEAAWRALKGTAYDHDAQLALLSLYERAHDWPQAATVARQLALRPAPKTGGHHGPAQGAPSVLPTGGGSLADRIAHYECEMAELLDTQGDGEQAQAALQRAQEAAAQASAGTARPAILAGRRLRRDGLHQQAVRAWDELRQRHPAAFVLVAHDYADSALQSADPALLLHARQALSQALAAVPSVELLRANEQLRPAAGAFDDSAATPAADNTRLQQLLQHLQQHPSLSAAQLLLEVPPAQWTDEAWTALRNAVARAARPLQRYRCAVCGFEAQHYFWQCPGCLSWDSYPAQRLDAQ
jgi:lipopolysaccharide biosynthesis regulator YciM